MDKYTIQDLQREFPDEDTCLEWIFRHRWPNGITCRKCGEITPHHRIAKRKQYACDRCGTHVAPLSGTVVEKSSTPLTLWFYAIMKVASTRTGYNAKDLQREIGVTYKTAWRMLKQIRETLAENRGPFSGEVEVDEAYLGNREGGLKRPGGANTKATVVGVVQRKGQIIVKQVPDRLGDTVRDVVRENVVPNGFTSLYTDEWRQYRKLDAEYNRQSVRHMYNEWRIGNAHTNTIESFWSNAKWSLIGVFRGVSQKYLQRYLDEMSFRYSHRTDNMPMFRTMLGRVTAIDRVSDRSQPQT